MHFSVFQNKNLNKQKMPKAIMLGIVPPIISACPSKLILRKYDH
ncbi:hypothetical protein EV03_0655 [Prochlorococcus marinus str. PAC1]|uniref:Uncharacterized protein n=1 Tax=Prochlorococcus marinus str. PAC1 TaxID=59924 RepID=A0A0A2C6R4_PROMR|nr:hypothetical protein EV03_0655 [Prochlorococcus marinus str. PAC1]